MNDKESPLKVRMKLLERAREVQIEGVLGMQYLSNDELIDRIRMKEVYKSVPISDEELKHFLEEIKKIREITGE